MAIMVILANIGIPALANVTQQKRSVVAATSIEDSFRYARSEALRLNAPIFICGAKFTVNSTLYGCASPDPLDWSAGVLDYVDYTDSGVFRGNSDKSQLKLTKFENSSVSSVKIFSSYPVYRVDPSSAISIPNSGSTSDFCFTLTQKINGKDVKSKLKLEKFGNAVYCKDENAKECLGC
jgi:type IV fimbrial biogenesis protein FimT